MGHEFVGEVLDVARGSRGGFQAGDRVVALPIVRASGGVHPTGLSAFAPGAYAEQVVVESSLAMKVPNGLATDVAALTEPLAVALHAVRRGEVGRKQVAIVIGCGPIGLAVIAMLKATGVRTVVASDFSAGRRVWPRRSAPTSSWTPRPRTRGRRTTRAATSPRPGQMFDLAVGSMEKLRAVPMVPWWHVMHAAELAGAMPQGPVVFECVGVPGIIDEIVARAPLASRVVVVGVTMQADTIRPAIAINKEIDLRFVLGLHPARVPRHPAAAGRRQGRPSGPADRHRRSRRRRRRLRRAGQPRGARQDPHRPGAARLRGPRDRARSRSGLPSGRDRAPDRRPPLRRPRRGARPRRRAVQRARGPRRRPVQRPVDRTAAHRRPRRDRGRPRGLLRRGRRRGHHGVVPGERPEPGRRRLRARPRPSG